jgi:hypothetical protein
MIISKSKNFVYIHLEKCGGTSIEFALEPYLLPTDILLGSTPKGEKLEYSFFKKYGYQSSLKKHSNSNEIKEFIPGFWDDMYKFATVRDPQKILISLYYYAETLINKINDFGDIKEFYLNDRFPPEWEYEMPYMLDYCRSIVDNTKLNGFVYRVFEKQRKEVLPQLLRVGEDVELFDISDIYSNWDDILKKININDDVPLKILNSSNKPTRHVDLNPESINLINKHFELDYVMMPDNIKQKWK